MATQVALAATAGHKRYIARGKNQLHTIFENHFSEFCDQYDERFAQKYGRFRLRRIESVAERFGTCGDYRHGVARIRCTNPEVWPRPLSAIQLFCDQYDERFAQKYGNDG